MDCRLTIDKDNSFLLMLQEESNAKRKVNMMIDDNGLSRVEGLITKVNADAPATIVMDNGQVIPLDKVIALNCVFSSDFSEC